MNIYYIEHSSFLIKNQNGKRILTDPFILPNINLEIDIVTISHNHFDHANTIEFSKETKILNTTDKFENSFCKIHGFETFHDNLMGMKRGPNIVFKIETDNINIVHLGDLGHVLSDEIIQNFENTHILFVPIGENYTLSLKELKILINKINPNIIIPMHYHSLNTNFSLESLDKFLISFKNFQKEYVEFLSLTNDSDILEHNKKIIVLDKLKSSEN